MSLQQAQEQLQNALVTTFLANLSFLSEYDNELYHRVDELSRMIESGGYKEKYALEFIQEEGEFDIYDIVNDKYLYERKPRKINNKLINDVQLDIKQAIFPLEQKLYQNQKVPKVPDEIRYNLTNLEHAYWLTKYDMSQFTSILKDDFNQRKRKVKHIEKFIFFGTLLGRHIPKIAQKIDADLYLVCERNLEIFRLSLFTVDYTILAKKGVLFSIMDDEQSEKKKIEIFIYNNFLKNFMFKFSSTHINVKEYIEKFLQYTVVHNPLIYDYIRYFYFFVKRTSHRINEKYRVLLLNKTKENLNFFKNKKVLYISAGPSLDGNIEWIKENQDKFFIVAIGAVYEKLLDNDIKVDMISTLDEQYQIVGTNHFREEAVTKIKDSIILASTVTNEEVLKRFNKNNLFLYEVIIPFFKDNIVVNGISVGELTLGLLLLMNVKELYIIGLDFSINQETGLTHSNSTSSIGDVYDLEREKNISFSESKKNFGARDGLVEVRGNKKEKVFTSGIFASSIIVLNDQIKSLKHEDTKIYNLSSTGAYFEQTIPIDTRNIDTKQFSSYDCNKKELVESLESHSLSKLPEKSKDMIINEIENLTKYLEKEFLEFEEKESEDYEEFYKNLMNVYEELFKITSKNTGILFSGLENYFKMIVNYLSFYFNNPKIKKEKEKIKKIRKIFSRQLRLILEDYIKFMGNLK